MKTYQLPESLNLWIEKYVKQLGFNLNEPKAIADAILQVSDRYQDKDSTTDWTKPARQVAYISYYLPLNYIRLLKVIDEAKSLGFFNPIQDLIDYGCGPGTGTKALLDSGVSLRQVWGVDNNQEAGKYFLDCPRKDTSLSFNTNVPARIQANTAIMAPLSEA